MATDSIGNATGTLGANATWGAGALESHAVAVGNSAFSGGGTVSFPVSLPAVFTLSFWVNASDYRHTQDNTGAYNNEVLGGETYLTDGFRSGFTPAGVYQFWTTQSGGTLTLSDAAGLPRNTWAQFAVSYSNGAASLYRDGAWVATASGALVPGSAGMGIDTGVGGVQQFFGAVGDVRLYDQALSASAIATLYQPVNCTPLTACPAPDNCGSLSNGCSGTVDCGTCSGSQSCGGGGTANVCGNAPADAGTDPIDANAFYVATNGVDSQAGTLAEPFATLTKCQSAMRANPTHKTCYIRAGSYAPAVTQCGGSCALDLTASDNGETWSYYPPDGVDSADITGGATNQNSGATVLIGVGNTSNVTINGLSLHNAVYAIVSSGGGTGHLTLKNNIIFNQFLVVGSGPQNAGGFQCYGCTSTTISHNVFHDIASFGLSNSQVNGDINNFLVEGNFFYNTCTTIADCGAIYFQDTTASATNIQIKSNFVRDGNTFAAPGSNYGCAIYPDDCTSNVVASGNVITGKNGGNTLMVHGGNNVQYLGNLIDLSTFKQAAETFQTSGVSGCSAGDMSGNKTQGNIIISAGGGGGYSLLSGSPHNAPAISGNDYHNYGGTPIATGSHYSDSAPVAQDPQLSGWTYSIQAGSPILGAPLSFPGLTSGWGPPGYVIPQSGTPPSCPH